MIALGVAATNTTIAKIITTLISNPIAAAAVVIQFLLGLALGYFAAKALKYVLAFVGILVLGAFLNVWSLGSSPQQALAHLGSLFIQLKDIAWKLASVLGLLTVGVTTVGFIVGAIIAWVRK